MVLLSSHILSQSQAICPAPDTHGSRSKSGSISSKKPLIILLAPIDIYFLCSICIACILWLLMYHMLSICCLLYTSFLLVYTTRVTFLLEVLQAPNSTSPKLNVSTFPMNLLLSLIAQSQSEALQYIKSPNTEMWDFSKPSFSLTIHIWIFFLSFFFFHAKSFLFHLLKCFPNLVPPLHFHQVCIG